jgi:hypothetical protein
MILALYSNFALSGYQVGLLLNTKGQKHQLAPPEGLNAPPPHVFEVASNLGKKNPKKKLVL